MRAVLVGPGRIGLSLAADLARSTAFGPVVVTGPEAEAPAFLTGLAGLRYLPLGAGSGGQLAPDRVASLLGGPDSEVLLLFTVPDGALAGAAAAWAKAVSEAGAEYHGIALHSSGFHTATELAPLAALGWSTGSWHPLAAVAAPRRDAFQGGTVGVEGDPRARAVAELLAQEVGAHVVEVRSGEKARWHAAAVLASNALVACLSAALRELEAAAGSEVKLADLMPLARCALEQVGTRGLPNGLTGPVARGDAETVTGHLAALDPATAALYRALAAELLRLASPRLDSKTQRALRAALETPDFGPIPG